LSFTQTEGKAHRELTEERVQPVQIRRKFQHIQTREKARPVQTDGKALLAQSRACMAFGSQRTALRKLLQGFRHLEKLANQMWG